MKLPLTYQKQRETPEFARFWEIYPRKESKGDARKAMGQALHFATIDEIMDGLAAQIRAGIFRKERQFVKLPATWLRKECWNDEISTSNDAILQAVGLSPQEMLH